MISLNQQALYEISPFTPKKAILWGAHYARNDNDSVILSETQCS